ncbi:hypothetical protein SDC9_153588 [bioreactor metagenome]|uniref:Uncharacterized protein n=1 Tax=bioreactor metagenome TaxID=1076179 RepID=A0A645EYK6_9ZZZZ
MLPVVAKVTGGGHVAHVVVCHTPSPGYTSLVGEVNKRAAAKVIPDGRSAAGGEGGIHPVDYGDCTVVVSHGIFHDQFMRGGKRKELVA